MSMLLKYFLQIFLINIITNVIRIFHCVNFNNMHMNSQGNVLRTSNKIFPHFNNINNKKINQSNLYLFINYHHLYIQQKNINFFKNNNRIYSQYYKNEPFYNTSNPIFNYEILDLIKIYGRLADHSEHISQNISIDINKNKFNEVPKDSKNYNYTNSNSIKENENDGTKQSIIYRILKRVFYFFQGKNINDIKKKGYWFDHFLKYGEMNYADFKKSIKLLKFKWPKDAIFPSYNIFLFEKGISKNSDSPQIRTKVENYLQCQDINEHLLKTCFYCFGNGKEHITAYDVLDTFRKWHNYEKNKKKFKNNEKEGDYIDWFIFKNKIDLCAIKMHESV
ncbi:conserved Plasmodium protein, unknown function [Plasmodium berghei]|uniref:Uncharacterized protein n=2 Tax=Plasmodium berghei TaxID=5821 RepID=A0A509AHL6_PLABA|nr:conserved Plasmodium protein, unknown function [Plasmodium berghei ANKA]CXI15923.1 conserved Plasmodium protein, unknown function [Plasmodium berghei]SCM19589.1 conserved Plasmodium protein, unknown function [Plasmodium berghei]SCN23334.1 conserved Plasmodium protein, unknown function [Plasmodium berghei]SCO59029.1 conserved Plasmodium protein, unknown function [Plasmodium berghei]SCO59584.1 conserved Plasmodium protein, unknown function [Plasmodium berghei]|eukprot:XP_034420541.1 conserved Plasmodium protein, unknown function [Plasmodium berghei ANKA]